LIKPPLRPPRLGRRLISLLLKRGEHWGLIGDFDELYAEKAAERGRVSARIWYWGQIARFAPAHLFNSLLWSRDMFKNHLIIAWRNIKKSKAYSALNILGLAAGMAVFILIMLFVRTELSYDRYHANAENIYRVTMESSGSGYKGSNYFAVTPGPLASAMVRDFPEVKAATRVKVWSDVLISIEKKSFMEKNVHWADPQTFDIFSFPLVRGDRAAVLMDPFSVLLSEREARRLFGGAEPLGRTITFRISNKTYEFRISGVFRNIPANSHFLMDVVAPFETMGKIQNENLSEWGSNSYHTYVLLKPGADARALDGQLPALIDRHEKSARPNAPDEKNRYFLLPLTKIHLHSGINFEMSPGGDVGFVLLFGSIAVLVLVIACVNYMNLATARSLKRTKEIGLRKVVGAAKGQIVRQFLGDSMLMTFLALLLAIGVVLLVLPAFRSFVEREIVFNPLRDLALMPGLILLAVIVGIAAGSYPAFFVSSFRPVSSLKGTGAAKTKGRGLRNGLIVFQFAASIALIICTIGVRGQLRFIRNRDMGYQREQIMVLHLYGDMWKKLDAFKAELKRNPAVLGAAASAYLPHDIGSTTTARWPGKPDSLQILTYKQEADYDFVDVYGLKIVKGRNFSRGFSSDAAGAFLINESAQKALGWADPIGRDFGLNREHKSEGKIVGVVKDFHMHSLHLPIMPLFIALEPTRVGQLSIKIRGENIPETIAAVAGIWERFAAGYPFEYSFFDELFDQTYRAEQRMAAIFSAFALLAILIACLGLIGLASFTAERRTREIGIRKVLGASSSGVVILLSREFMKWVVLANLIAWPIGYFAMRAWLQNFAYRMALTPAMFLGAALAAFFFAAAVISLQTYRAANANPADSIRYE
jgi:putative ABC transport system permease protein